MATVKENILNSLGWFYDKLTSLYLKPIIKMLLTGKVYGWLLDRDGNVIMSNEDDGIVLSWRMYEHDMIADYFDESLTYNVGDYCVYDNKLYKFVSQKSPGAWSDSTVGVVNVMEELGDNAADISSLQSSVSSLDSSKAPTSHASSATTYGVGTTSNYGHCRTINNLTTSSHTDGYALSAYQGYVLNSNKSNVLATQTVQVDNITVGNGTQTSVSIDMSWSGYTILGFCGWSIGNASSSGTGSGSVMLRSVAQASSGTWTCYLRNVASSDAKVYLTMQGLYVKNS